MLCVEQGRWEQDGNRGHRAAGRRVSASLRTSRDRAYRRGTDPQHAVLSGIASRYETSARTATNSPSVRETAVRCWWRVSRSWTT